MYGCTFKYLHLCPKRYFYAMIGSDENSLIVKGSKMTYIRSPKLCLFPLKGNILNCKPTSCKKSVLTVLIGRSSLMAALTM